MAGWGKRIAAVVLFAALVWTREGLELTYHREVEAVKAGETFALMAADDGDGDRAGRAHGFGAGIEPGHEHGPGEMPPPGRSSGTAALHLALGETAPGHVHGPGCGHADHHHHAHPAASGAADPDHRHDHDGHDQGEGEEHPEGISNGMVLLLKHLGLQELAANLLWVQMDADSHQGLWHRVEFALELIPTIDPHFVEAYLLHAYMLDRFKGEHRRSIEVLQTGLRNNPWRSELWIQLGVQFFNVNRQHGPDRDLEKALAMFSQACRLSDCPGYIFRFRAIVLTCLNRREEAIAWLEQVRASPGRFGGDQQQDDHLLQRLRAGETWE